MISNLIAIFRPHTWHTGVPVQSGGEWQEIAPSLPLSGYNVTQSIEWFPGLERSRQYYYTKPSKSRCRC